MSTPDQTPPKRRFGRRSSSGKPGRIAQYKQAYTLTKQYDPAVTWWMLGALIGVTLIGVLIGVLTGHPIYWAFLGLMAGVLVAMIVLARRADKAMYKQLDGQPGAAYAPLMGLRGGWIVEDKPVAVDARTQDSVFRVLGRPGVVLVSDGPPHRVGKLLAEQEKKHRRFVSNAPIILIMAGAGEGQVPMNKLTRHIMRLKGTLTKDEVAKIQARLKSMPTLQPPIPKGIDPTRARPDRKATRGR